MNWVHVDNLVTAHLLAAEGLTARRNRVSVSRRSKPGSDESRRCLSVLFVTRHRVPPQSGQVYFINDGVSVNVFEWLTPLVS